MSSVETKRNLQAVGMMKIVAPQETSSAPSYGMLPKETNLDVALVQTDDWSEKVKSRITGEVDSNLRKKCEALAVEALAEHGADVDVIAPVEVVKQIFRTPYSRSSRVSVLVQRVGKTVILNPGFDDAEEPNNRPGCAFEDEDKYNYRFLSFLIQSKRRIEGRDCSPEQISGKMGPFGPGDSEKHRGSGSNGFSRVVDFQLDKLRMRLGSDPILFSDKVGEAISLHLSDLSQQVLPLTWLEVWLDNYMASVPALAIGYHCDGLVDGYEFLKTEAIFGIFGDDEPAFDPKVVLRSGLELLKSVQSTCEKDPDPGVYWLYKRAGEDVFYLSSEHSSSTNPMPPSLINSCRTDLANLLYRVSHRLSFSVRPDDSIKCALFLSKRWNILEESDHQAHEQFARLILSNKEEFDLVIIDDRKRDYSASPDYSATFSGAKLTQDYSASPDSLVAESSVVNSSSVGSFDSGPVCQAPASLISLKLAAVDHVSQAIKSLAKKQHPTSEQEDLNLLLLLAESYLSLAEAYNEDGELHQCLKNVDLACSFYGSMPQNKKSEEERCFVSAVSDSFPLQLSCKKFDELMGVNSSQVEAKPEPSYSSFNNLSPSSLFWAKVWLLVGETYVKIHFKQLPFSPLEMPSSEVAEEVEKLKTKLLNECASCSLVSCTCKLETKMGGIFIYLRNSSKVDAESNLLAAIECFDKTLNALRNLPRSCEEIQSVHKRKASLWIKISKGRLDSQKFNEYEEAADHAILALKECCKHVEAIVINRNMGARRLMRAINLSNKTDRKDIDLETAKQECKASIDRFDAAQEDISQAIVQGLDIPENVTVELCKFRISALVRFGSFLCNENTTDIQLSAAIGAIEKGIAVYRVLEKDVTVRECIASAYFTLAQCYTASYISVKDKKFLKANEHASRAKSKKADKYASLASENYQKAVDMFRSVKSHHDFLRVLTRRSIFFVDIPEREHMLKLELSSLLQARYISNTDEESIAEKTIINDFWKQLEKVLGKMISLAKKKTKNLDKLKRLHKYSLAATKKLSDLNGMHDLWTSK